MRQALAVKLLLGECHRNSLMISQYWLRQWLVAITWANVDRSVSPYIITRPQWVEMAGTVFCLGIDEFTALNISGFSFFAHAHISYFLKTYITYHAALVMEKFERSSAPKFSHRSIQSFFNIEVVNSFAHGRCGCNLELVIFKLILRIPLGILSISCEIFLRWIP